MHADHTTRWLGLSLDVKGHNTVVLSQEAMRSLCLMDLATQVPLRRSAGLDQYGVDQR